MKGGHENETFAANEALFSSPAASAWKPARIQRRKMRGGRKIIGSKQKINRCSAKNHWSKEKIIGARRKIIGARKRS
jgi:hypothetical protein